MEVLNAAGGWVAGFELLATNPDGTASIRSRHTGMVKCLPPDQWRDPLEAVDLGEPPEGWPAVLAQFPEINGIHPALALVPLGTAEEIQRIERSIARHGLERSVTIDGDGLLLDGRLRVLACHRTGRELLIKDYLGNDPVAYVRSANVIRQHLSAAEKAEVRRKLTELVGTEKSAELLEVAS